MSNKVFVVGLDGATFDIIKPLIKEGKLPTFKKLIENGAYGELESTILPITAPAWTSFLTGVNPGKHGVFDFVKLRSNYEITTVNSKDIKSDPLWKIFSKNKKKSIFIDVPMTYPIDELNDCIIFAGFPALRGSKKRTIYPPYLEDEIKEVLGIEYKIGMDFSFGKNFEDDLIEFQNQIISERTKLTKYLMKNYEWDFFMVCFYNLDAVSHWFWKYHDNNHPKFVKNAKYGKVIRENYIKIDRILSEILRDIDKDTTLVIMSDHGFGPVYKSLFINNFFLKNNFLKFKRNPITMLKYLLSTLGLNQNKIYRILYKFKIENIIKQETKKEKSHVIKLKNKFFLSFSDIDYRRSRAFSIGNIGQIYINMKNKFDHGCVDEEDLEKVRNEIIEKLKELKDDETGNLIIDKIYKKEEIYHGKYLKDAPDIIFLTKDLLYTTSNYFEFGSNKIIEDSLRWSGNHKMNGILIIYGPNIKKGVKISNPKIIDVAPTILYVMNIPIPRYMDGRILTSVFSYVKEIKYEEDPEKEYIASKIKSIKFGRKL